MNKYEMLHETVLRDVVDAIEYGKIIKDSDKNDYNNILKGRQGHVGSIAKRTSNLILVFPVLVSSSLSIKTANIISKAIERKCVALLQILFSAISLTESRDLFGYIKQIHSNLGTSVDLDSFITILDGMVQEGAINVLDTNTYEAVKEDLLNINFHLDESFNETAITEYTSKYNTSTGNTSIVLTEAPGKDRPVSDIKMRNDLLHALRNDLRNQDKRFSNDMKNQNKTFSNDMKNLSNDMKNQNKSFSNDMKNQTKAINDIGNRIDKYNANRANDAAANFAQDRVDYFRHQLLPQDVQKSNELMPTLMAVNFTTYDAESGFKHTQTGVVGVKAKVYPVDSMEIVNRLSTKYTDSNSFFKLIQASTREISFFKDFVFGVNKAKLDAIEVARNSGSARIFKLLERRAAKNRVASLLKKNDASPITSLVVSEQEVEYLKKYNNTDIENRQVAKTILVNFNLMDIVIADETIEVAKFMYDDDTTGFENLTFDALERESKDNSYKKVLNLLSKVR
jgi:hypothetical protein